MPLHNRHQRVQVLLGLDLTLGQDCNYLVRFGLGGGYIEKRRAELTELILLGLDDLFDLLNVSSKLILLGLDDLFNLLNVSSELRLLFQDELHCSFYVHRSSIREKYSIESGSHRGTLCARRRSNTIGPGEGPVRSWAG